jgi:predicted ATP-dependent endonuclease of OLD family
MGVEPRKLMEILLQEAQTNNIQIVLTTHSLEVLSWVSSRIQNERQSSCAMWYLSKPFGAIQFQHNPDIETIYRNLSLTSLGSTPIIPKVNIYVEDAEATLFLKKILGTRRSLSPRFKITVLDGGYKKLKALAKWNLEELRHTIFIIDGDQRISEQYPPNLLVLPGESSPEKVFGDFLARLPEDDRFWTKDYTKQHFINAFPTADVKREGWKTWFNQEKQNWGKRNMSKLYQRWKQDNQASIDNFLNKVITQYNKIVALQNIPPFEH